MQCIYSHHQPSKVMAICLKSTCDMQSRLLCFQCLTKEHASHNDWVVNLDEVVRGAKSKDVPKQMSIVENYPMIQKSRSQSETKRSHTKTEQSQKWANTLKAQEICEILNNTLEHLNETKIEILFQQLKKRLNEQLEFTKQVLKEKVSDLKKSAIITTYNLQQIFNETYNLKAIFQVYNQHLCKLISLSEFNQRIEHLLSAKSREQSEQQLQFILNKEIKKLNFILDESDFNLQTDKIVHNIYELANVIKHNSKQDIKFIKSIQHASKEVQIHQIDTQQKVYFPLRWAMIYTNIVLESGRYNFKVNLDSKLEGSLCIGMLQEEKRDKYQMDSTSIFINLNKADNSKITRKITNDHQGEGAFVKGDTIDILVDVDHNIFQIQDHDRKNQVELNNAKLRGKRWRLFLLDPDGRQTNITILKATKLD